MSNLSSTTLGVDISDNGHLSETMGRSRCRAVQGGFTVQVSTSDGTATTADSDYTAVSLQTLSFSGTEGETQAFTVTPTADTKLEGNETLTVSMSNLSSTTLGVDISDGAEVTITNDDAAAVTIEDVNGAEDNGAITLTATLNRAVQGGFTVQVGTSDGTATTADSDYTAVSLQTLSFSGTEGETQAFTVTPTADTKLEGNETLTVSMSNLSSTTLGVDISDGAEVTITNDDAAAVTIEDVSGAEDDGAITLTATLSRAVQGGFTVQVGTSDGTATTADSDYTAVSLQTLSFSGTEGETQAFTLSPTADTKLEGNETLTVSMSNLSSTTLGVDISDGAEVTITNDDEALVLIEDVSRFEDDGSITISAVLTNFVEGGFTVTLNTQDASATVADNDYIAVTEYLITFVGNKDESYSLTIDPVIDRKYEEDETFNIILSDLAATTLPVDITDQATITILNDDHHPVASLIEKTGNEDIPVIFSPNDFTNSFSDDDDDALVKVEVVSLPLNGTLRLNGSPISIGQEIDLSELGNITFIPSSNWNGTTSFLYNATDGINWAQADASITVRINPINDSPEAIDDKVVTEEDTPVSGSVITNDSDIDGDRLTVVRYVIDGTTYNAGNLVEISDIGSLVIESNGSFEFIPESDFNGNVPSVTYTISDGHGGTDTAILEISVNNENDEPIVKSEVFNLCNSDILTGNILENGDYDPDGTQLAVDLIPVKLPDNGTFEINSSGDFTYTPNEGYSGIDVIILAVCDNGIPLPSACSNDTLTINVANAVYAYAGDDDVICQGETYTLSNASTTNAGIISWATSGSGIFDDSTVANPVYTPSEGDIQAGQVVLTVTAELGEICGAAQDEMVLTITQKSNAYAGDDDVICQGETYTLSNASTTNAGIISWATSGSGIFDDSTVANPVYTPSEGDIQAGQIVLTITAELGEICGAAQDEMVLTITQKSNIDAGADRIACVGDEVLISDATAENYTAINWTSNGQGTILGVNSLTPTYVPAEDENGQVKLSLTADGINGCANETVTDQVVIEFHSLEVEIENVSGVVPYNTSVSLSAKVYPGVGTYSYQWSPVNLVTGDNLSTIETVDLTEDTEFEVLATDLETGCTAVDTIFIIIEKTVDKVINIRNGISPNGDGNNDIWYIEGIEKFTDNDVVIFNRWGDVIVKLKNYDNTNVYWDGLNSKGNHVPDGTYYYIIDIKGIKSFSGWIQVRNGF